MPRTQIEIFPAAELRREGHLIWDAITSNNRTDRCRVVLAITSNPQGWVTRVQFLPQTSRPSGHAMLHLLPDRTTTSGGGTAFKFRAHLYVAREPGRLAQPVRDTRLVKACIRVAEHGAAIRGIPFYMDDPYE